MNGVLLALGAGARFVARSADTLQDHLPGVIADAHAHRGAAFVEILQNCIVFYDGAFGVATDKAASAEHTIRLAQGAPLVFGKDNDKGLIVNCGTGQISIVAVGTDVELSDVTMHDQTNHALAMALGAMDGTSLPLALGVLYADAGPEFTTQRQDTREHGFDREGLRALLNAGATWQRPG